MIENGGLLRVFSLARTISLGDLPPPLQMCELTTRIAYNDHMPVCNLLGNIYNKAYRSILGNIIISNDGRICFIDKNIMENITSVISWQPC